MTPKKKDVLKRIRSLENAIRRANEYLESGNHANWVGFRPIFVDKKREGKSAPPHKDWVRNVFLLRMETAWLGLKDSWGGSAGECRASTAASRWIRHADDLALSSSACGDWTAR